MADNLAVIITSISKPNEVMRRIAEEAKDNGFLFIVAGDLKSPVHFDIDGCTFLSIERQKECDFRVVEKLPYNHYSRKNIGYLCAMKSGCAQIIETDDDNYPALSFFKRIAKSQTIPVFKHNGWINVYKYFSEEFVWPRGYPLEEIKNKYIQLEEAPVETVDCPIQQGLVDGEPDVDAVFRLLFSPVKPFKKHIKVGLGEHSWCPFNSQNTVWWPEVFPLMYLPSFCTFRMTDIWRSFVAQRIAWENNWYILFDEATVIQERNVHNLLKDFQDEIPGYMNNNRIAKEFTKLKLRSGIESIPYNMFKCYNKLIEMQLVGAEELDLLKEWLSDIERIR